MIFKAEGLFVCGPRAMTNGHQTLANISSKEANFPSCSDDQIDSARKAILEIEMMRSFVVALRLYL
jgi:hypothetical protein